MTAGIILYRLAVKEAAGWRVTYFVSEAECELSERAASIAGLSTIMQSVTIPTAPQKLAEWLSDNCEVSA